MSHYGHTLCINHHFQRKDKIYFLNKGYFTSIYMAEYLDVTITYLVENKGSAKYLNIIVGRQWCEIRLACNMIRLYIHPYEKIFF